MGETHVRFKLSGLPRNHWEEFSALVDTGATFTSLPRKSLESLGIHPEQEAEVLVADGRSLQRWLSHAWIEIQGIQRINTIMLGEEGDASVIGVTTLETCLLGVDPATGRVFPRRAIHYRAAGKFPARPTDPCPLNLA